MRYLVRQCFNSIGDECEKIFSDPLEARIYFRELFEDVRNVVRDWEVSCSELGCSFEVETVMYAIKLTGENSTKFSEEAIEYIVSKAVEMFKEVDEEEESDIMLVRNEKLTFWKEI